MPRDGSGVYSLPPGTTVAPNTTIESSWANALTSDLAQDANTARPITAGGTGETSARLKDGTWRFQNTSDTTKLLALDLTGLTTATTLTVKVPNGQPTYGQCLLALDGSNLRLSPFNGDLLTINGYGHKVPNAGVTLAPSGLSTSTLYYIYAYMNSGTMTLEASTTAPTTHTDGVRIKTGDATRSLVGMVQVLTGPVFSDTAAIRYVRTWYNRAPVSLQGAGVASTRTTTSTSLTEINTETRINFLIWADENVELWSNGWSLSSTTAEVQTAVGVDGTTTRTRTCTTYGTNGGPAVSMGTISGLSVGSHYATLIGAASSGTASWVTTSGARDAVAVGGLICP